MREYIREAEAVRVPGAEAALSAKLEVVILKHFVFNRYRFYQLGPDDDLSVSCR